MKIKVISLKTFLYHPCSLLKASTEAVQNMKHAILHFAPLKTAQYNAIMSNHKMHIRLRCEYNFRSVPEIDRK